MRKAARKAMGAGFAACPRAYSFIARLDHKSPPSRCMPPFGSETALVWQREKDCHWQQSSHERHERNDTTHQGAAHPRRDYQRPTVPSCLRQQNQTPVKYDRFDKFEAVALMENTVPLPFVPPCGVVPYRVLPDKKSTRPRISSVAVGIGSRDGRETIEVRTRSAPSPGQPVSNPDRPSARAGGTIVCCALSLSNPLDERFLSNHLNNSRQKEQPEFPAWPSATKRALEHKETKETERRQNHVRTESYIG